MPRPRKRPQPRDVFDASTGVPASVSIAMAPVEQALHAADRRWGFGRLEGLLPVEPPAHIPPERHDDWRSIVPRYGEAMDAYNDAVRQQDPKAIAQAGQRVVRAIAILERQCKLCGIEPPEHPGLGAEVEGRRVVIIPDGVPWKAVADANPGADVITASAAAYAWVKAMSTDPMVVAAKEAFPDAVIEVSTPAQRVRLVEDEIPF